MNIIHYEPLKTAPKGPAIDTVDKESEVQLALKAEGESIRESGSSLEEDIASVEAQFIELEAAGNTFPVVLHRSKGAVIDWPIETVDAEPRGPGVPHAADPWPVIVSLHHDELLARALEQVRQHHAALPTPNLSADAKRARLREIRAKLFESRRRQSEAIWQLKAEGRDASFPRDADPRAVLGLPASTTLPPKR